MILVTPPDQLQWRGNTYRCALGRSGVSPKKREGDGATPVGTFPLLRVLFRADRLDPPESGLPYQAIKKNDGWCDDPASTAYNQAVSLPHNASHERLWREDSIYDVIVVIGYNNSPVIPSRGSAVFIHVAKPSFQKTAGCVSLEMHDLLDVLHMCSANTTICIQDY